MGNWKCVKKVIAKALKLLNEVIGSSMNYFENFLFKVQGKRCKQIMSSNNELEMHHK
jgi:hypothetical protein